MSHGFHFLNSTFLSASSMENSKHPPPLQDGRVVTSSENYQVPGWQPQSFSILINFLSFTQVQGYRDPPNHFPYEGVCSPIFTLDLCAVKFLPLQQLSLLGIPPKRLSLAGCQVCMHRGGRRTSWRCFFLTRKTGGKMAGKFRLEEMRFWSNRTWMLLKPKVS